MATQTATTADEAYDLYREAFDHDALIQSGWHSTSDEGRQLACALGVLGPEIDDARKCPSAIMPCWLAQMVPWLFDGQNFDAAKTWGIRFYTELKRIKGAVPFSVVHDWYATVVGPLAIEVSAKRGGNVAAHQALAAMQTQAAAGHKFSADEWLPVLKKAFQDAYADADANADANAYAYANAKAYTNAYAYAYAYAYADATKRLADGMVDCLARVSTPV